MMGKIAGMDLTHGLTIETTLDPKVQAFLYDHQIDGTPVLPGVMGVEAFAEAALRILPGWHIEAIDEVNFLAPFKFYRSEARTVTIQAIFAPCGDGLIASCKLTGSRTLPNQAEPQITTHFTGRVRLTKHPASAGFGLAGQEHSPLERPLPEAVTAPHGSTMEASDIYRLYFHGPAYRVLERAWRDGNRIVGQMAKSLPTHHQPPERPTTVSPRLIELCFQTAGLWEMSAQGRMGLPSHIHQVCVRPASDPDGAGVLAAEGHPEAVNQDAAVAERTIFAVVTPDPEHGSFDAEVVDAAGNPYVHLRGYRTAALPNIIDSAPLKALSAAA